MQQWRFPDLKWDGTDRGFRASLFEFYQAPRPWGPWTKFYTSPLFTQANILGMYNPCIPSKFISEDGKDMVVFANGRFSSDEYKLLSIPCHFRTDPVDNHLSFDDTDKETQGNWLGKYGSNGYHLPSFSFPHLVAGQPDYAKVVFARAKRTQLSAAPDDQSKMIIPNPPSNEEKKAALAEGVFPQEDKPSQRNGAYYYSQDMLCDVYLGQGKQNTLSLYFVDDGLYDDIYGSREMQVEAIDGDTDKVIDSRIVKDYSEGIYLKYKVKGHAKFRITRLKGSDAMLAGILFD